MNELFNTDNSFWQTVGKAGDMILLTLLAVFCSLSLITLGASLSALYYVAFKIKTISKNGVSGIATVAFEIVIKKFMGTML